jgi:hypothetical protein
MDKGGAERRVFPRFNLLVDVSFNKASDGVAPGGKENLTVTRNVSSGGVCLIAYEEVKQDDILDLSIFLPEEKEPMKIRGRVAWVKEFSIGEDPEVGKRYDAGVEFIEVNDEKLAVLKNYLFTHSLAKEL